MASAAADQEFHLDATVPDDRKGQAAFYGVCELSVTRWKKAGKAAKDGCPLKTPALMADWYQRVFPGKAVPAGIEKAAAQWRASSPVPAVTAGTPESGQHIALRDVDTGAEGDMLTRLRADEARLHTRYREAIVGELDEKVIRQYREQWQEAAGALDLHLSRKKKRGETLDPEEVDRAFRRIYLTLPEALRRSFPVEPPPADSWAATCTAAIRCAFEKMPGTLAEMLTAAAA